MKIKVKLENQLYMPEKKHSGDSGFDLKAALRESHTILKPGNILQIDSGVAIELPEGFEGQVRGRSSLNQKGIVALLGTIDSGYRGKIGIVLINLSKEDYIINRGDRVAQLVIAPIYSHKIDLQSVELLDVSDRGSQGFGSTGK